MTVIDKEVLKAHKEQLDRYVKKLDLEQSFQDERELYDMIYTLGVLVQHLLEEG